MLEDKLCFVLCCMSILKQSYQSFNHNWQAQNITGDGSISMNSMVTNIWPIPYRTDFNGTITITTNKDIGDFFRAQLNGYSGPYEQKINLINEVTGEWKINNVKKNTTFQLYFKSQFSKFDKGPYFRWILCLCSARYEKDRNCQDVPDLVYWKGQFILRYAGQQQQSTSIEANQQLKTQ